MSRRFVSVPTDRLLGELRDIGASVTARGGTFVEGVQGREVVFDIVPPGGRAMVRVFTSVAVGAVNARDCGEDAVRIVMCVATDGGVRPISKSMKILRTAPNDAADRVGVFLSRLRDSLRGAYVATRSVRGCPDCGRVMAERDGKHGKFLGCVGFPACRRTAPV